MTRRLLLLILGFGPVACIPTVNPRTTAIRRGLPPRDEARALVVFGRPPRCDGDEYDRLRNCYHLGQLNRMRITEKGGRFVTDLALSEYATLVEEPGEHVYVAAHWGEASSASHPMSVGVLHAHLEPGRAYFVTLAQTMPPARHVLDYRRVELSRFDFASVPAQALAPFREWLLTRAQWVDTIAVDGDDRDWCCGWKPAMLSSQWIRRAKWDAELGAKAPELGPDDAREWN